MTETIKFKCPKCGHSVLEKYTKATVLYHVTDIDVETQSHDHGSQDIVEEYDINYQCRDCGFMLIDNKNGAYIETQKELVYWIKENCHDPGWCTLKKHAEYKIVTIQFAIPVSDYEDCCHNPEHIDDVICDGLNDCYLREACIEEGTWFDDYTFVQPFETKTTGSHPEEGCLFD